MRQAPAVRSMNVSSDGTVTGLVVNTTGPGTSVVGHVLNCAGANRANVHGMVGRSAVNCRFAARTHRSSGNGALPLGPAKLRERPRIRSQPGTGCLLFLRGHTGSDGSPWRQRGPDIETITGVIPASVTIRLPDGTTAFRTGRTGEHSPRAAQVSGATPVVSASAIPAGAEPLED